ncbi:MAG: aromatic ring-hydroxylating dioxygenase subunit alpha, partial [Candidatus Limnocylindrales bacterium]
MSVVSPISATDVAAVRQPVAEAHLLPARVFHDADVFAFEQERWFATTWLCAGRDEDVGEPGTYLLARAAGESVIVL